MTSQPRRAVGEGGQLGIGHSKYRMCALNSHSDCVNEIRFHEPLYAADLQAFCTRLPLTCGMRVESDSVQITQFQYSKLSTKVMYIISTI